MMPLLSSQCLKKKKHPNLQHPSPHPRLKPPLPDPSPHSPPHPPPSHPGPLNPPHQHSRHSPSLAPCPQLLALSLAQCPQLPAQLLQALPPHLPVPARVPGDLLLLLLHLAPQDPHHHLQQPQELQVHQAQLKIASSSSHSPLLDLPDLFLLVLLFQVQDLFKFNPKLAPLQHPMLLDPLHPLQPDPQPELLSPSIMELSSLLLDSPDHPVQELPNLKPILPLLDHKYPKHSPQDLPQDNFNLDNPHQDNKYLDNPPQDSKYLDNPDGHSQFLETPPLSDLNLNSNRSLLPHLLLGPSHQVLHPRPLANPPTPLMLQELHLLLHKQIGHHPLHKPLDLHQLLRLPLQPLKQLGHHLPHKPLDLHLHLNPPDLNLPHRFNLASNLFKLPVHLVQLFKLDHPNKFKPDLQCHHHNPDLFKTVPSLLLPVVLPHNSAEPLGPHPLSSKPGPKRHSLLGPAHNNNSLSHPKVPAHPKGPSHWASLLSFNPKADASNLLTVLLLVLLKTAPRHSPSLTPLP